MKRRILIVDDDIILCEELADFFQEVGFTVKYALTPSEGIDFINRNSYDVLLLDFKMPQFDGIEFLERVQDRLSGMSIFIMSGSLSITQMLKDRGVSSQVTGVFAKPFDVQALHSAINNANPS